jgi:hypothetical protein
MSAPYSCLRGGASSCVRSPPTTMLYAVFALLVAPSPCAMSSIFMALSAAATFPSPCPFPSPSSSSSLPFVRCRLLVDCCLRCLRPRHRRCHRRSSSPTMPPPSSSSPTMPPPPLSSSSLSPPLWGGPWRPWDDCGHHGGSVYFLPSFTYFYLA